MDNQYLNFAIKLAKKAGAIAKKNFSLGMKKQWKKDQTPVTETDLLINKMVIDEINKNFSNHSILGEEIKNIKKSEFVWVCDPIDGTVPFSHGIPIFTFSLALVKNGNPLMGVIYDIMVDRLFYAQKNKGAYLNGKKIFVNKSKNFKNQILNLDADFSNFYLLFKEKIFKDNAFLSVIYSATYGGILVACGEYIAEIYKYDKPWDGASVKILVEEAGGKVTDIKGKEQRYDREINGFIASNGIIHNQILEILKISYEKNGNNYRWE